MNRWFFFHFFSFFWTTSFFQKVISIIITFPKRKKNYSSLTKWVGVFLSLGCVYFRLASARWNKMEIKWGNKQQKNLCIHPMIWLISRWWWWWRRTSLSKSNLNVKKFWRNKFWIHHICISLQLTITIGSVSNQISLLFFFKMWVFFSYIKFVVVVVEWFKTTTTTTKYGQQQQNCQHSISIVTQCYFD